MRTRGLRPSYQVVSTLLLALAALGLGFKILGRFLPESQPNRVASEYSTFLQAVGRQKVDWYPYSAEAFARARSLDRLIYIEIGSVFSRRSNSVAERFYTEEEFARLLHSHFVAIRVDMLELPGVALAIANNTSAFVDLEGAIFAVLTPEGYPVALTGYRQLRRSVEPLGMHEWLSEIARAWVRDKDKVREEARKTLENQINAAAELIAPGPVSFDIAASFADQLARSFDAQTGRLGNRPAPLATPCLTMLLSLKATYENGRRWLLALRYSPTYDHVHGGFFEESPQGWWSPAYGKRAGRSAQYASMLAASETNDDLIQFAARQTVDWLINNVTSRDNPLFAAGMGSDELVLDGSRYYDYSPGELPTGSPFRITPTRSPGPVFLPPPAWSIKRENLQRGVEQLADLSNERKPPILDTSTFTDENARVISALAETAIWLDELELRKSVASKFTSLSQDRVFGLGDVEHAPSGRAKTTGFCGDYVWMARAAIDVYRLTGNKDLLHLATRIMNRIRELFADSDGLIVTRLRSERIAAFEFDLKPLADDYYASILSVYIRNLQDLASISGDAQSRYLALRLLQNVSGSVQKLGVRGAGIVQAMLEHFRPAILVAAADPLPFAHALQRRHPGHFVAPSPDPDAPVGYYWVESGVKQGPFTLAQVEARIRLSAFR